MWNCFSDAKELPDDLVAWWCPSGNDRGTPFFFQIQD